MLRGRASIGDFRWFGDDWFSPNRLLDHVDACAFECVLAEVRFAFLFFADLSDFACLRAFARACDFPLLTAGRFFR